MNYEIRTCKRCGYVWKSKSTPGTNSYKYPKTCARPQCKSPYWDREYGKIPKTDTKIAKLKAESTKT